MTRLPRRQRPTGRIASPTSDGKLSPRFQCPTLPTAPMVSHGHAEPRDLWGPATSKHEEILRQNHLQVCATSMNLRNQCAVVIIQSCSLASSKLPRSIPTLSDASESSSITTCSTGILTSISSQGGASSRPSAVTFSPDRSIRYVLAYTADCPLEPGRVHLFLEHPWGWLIGAALCHQDDCTFFMFKYVQQRLIIVHLKAAYPCLSRKLTKVVI